MGDLAMSGKVLSAQSFVVHGYVGNKCSMFALQTLGFDVDPINTVQLSNHTGYPKWKGQVLGGQSLADLWEGLRENGLHTAYTHLLTGYFRDPAALRTVAAIRDDMKKSRPELVYVCDPVMGDGGKLYVPEEVAQVYREDIVRRADVVKLNQTELEYLAGVALGSLSSAPAGSLAQAIDAVHAMGPRCVVVSSVSDQDGDDGYINVVGSSLRGTGAPERFRMRLKRLSGYYSGTGDLFAALLLAWTAKGEPLQAACERSVASIQAVLERTVRAGSRELLLIQSKKDIECPDTTAFRAVPFNN
eukprot:m51a1_g9039 putative pyridoxal kinase (302) ;mRNA; r:849-1973